LPRLRWRSGARIAEALIATAMAVRAIPAVVGYNRYTHDIDRLANRMESFMEEFSNILQRQTTTRSDSWRAPASKSPRSTSCR